MLVSKINSGLGNQLFQYFTSFELSKRYNQELYLETSFKKDNKRSFLLDKFDLNLKLREKSMFDTFNFELIKDKEKGFQNIILKENRSYKLDGYWQSPKYFNSHKSFIINKIYKPINLKEIYSLSIQTLTVSIHVRRGDYVTNKQINNKFMLYEINFFNKAINIIEDLFKDKKIHYLIFSDDFNYIKENFKFLENKNIIKSNINNPMSEFQMMMSCDHHIIPNSTFSWWAAWINPNPKKKVLCPKKWFKLNKDNVFIKDLLPLDWIIVDEL